MTDTAELIERLRDLRPMPWDDDIAETGAEAATALETLQAENERLLHQVNGYKDALAQAEGVIADLRAGIQA